MTNEQIGILLGGLGLAAFGAFRVRSRPASLAVQGLGVGLSAYALFKKSDSPSSAGPATLTAEETPLTWVVDPTNPNTKIPLH